MCCSYLPARFGKDCNYIDSFVEVHRKEISKNKSGELFSIARHTWGICHLACLRASIGPDGVQVGLRGAATFTTSNPAPYVKLDSFFARIGQRRGRPVDTSLNVALPSPLRSKFFAISGGSDKAQR